MLSKPIKQPASWQLRKLDTGTTGCGANESEMRRLKKEIEWR